MKIFTIPCRIIAIAADEAARIHDEKAADAFDDDCASRSRWTAIAAIRIVFPLASQISIARHFGCCADAKAIGIRMQNAKLANWWSDETVRSIAQTIAPHSAMREREPTVEVHEDMGARIAPMARAVAMNRVRNVTSSMMGDPPAGRREMLAAMPVDRSYSRVAETPRRVREPYHRAVGL